MFDSDKAYKRYSRRERHNRIWGILRFMLVIHSFNERMNSFYDYQNRMKDYESAISFINADHRPTIQDINLVIRLCRIKYSCGKCDYEVKEVDVSYIYNWYSYQIDHKKILEGIIPLFREYWDGVLLEYKGISAKKNRIEYLIDLLEDIREKDYIISNSLDDRISELIDYYEKSL